MLFYLVTVGVCHFVGSVGASSFLLVFMNCVLVIGAAWPLLWLTGEDAVCVGLVYCSVLC